MGPTGVFSVRRASPGDIDALLVLQQEAFGEDPFCLDRADFAALSRSRGNALLVAQDEGPPLGYAVLRKRLFRPWASLDFVAVSQESRRTGIGRALIAAVLPLVGRSSLRLVVRTENHGAVAFYGDQDFEPAGLRPGHYADGCDGLVMIRRL